MIQSMNHVKISVNHSKQMNPTPKMAEAKESIIEHSFADTVEISLLGREMAVGSIIHTPAKYFGTIEIDEALTDILDKKSDKVKEAVYSIIQSNFITDGNTASNDEERATLLEAGLSQIKYIANHYMTEEESKRFLVAMDQIAAIAKTRTVDPNTGKAAYLTPPQKPKGAPSNYINTTEVMKRFEPDTYNKLQDAIVDGGNWVNILTDFVKKVPKNPQWIEKYRQESIQIENVLKRAKIENRFKNADTSDLQLFLTDMNRMIQLFPIENKTFLTKNMEYFYFMLK